MQNCLNFSVDRSTKAKHATTTHTYPFPALPPGNSVAAGHKEEGENRPPSRKQNSKLKQQIPPRQHANSAATVPPRFVSPAPLRGTPQ